MLIMTTLGSCSTERDCRRGHERKLQHERAAVVGDAAHRHRADPAARATNSGPFAIEERRLRVDARQDFGDRRIVVAALRASFAHSIGADRRWVSSVAQRRLHLRRERRIGVADPRDVADHIERRRAPVAVRIGPMTPAPRR